MHSVLDRTSTIGVIGAGTMGTGIAQLAAQHGHKVVLYDSTNEALVNARSNLAKVFARLVEKGTLTSQEAEEVKRRITFADGLRGLSHCKLVVEAIVEDMSVKQDLFQQLDHIVSESCIIATNTSSLSVMSSPRAWM